MNPDSIADLTHRLAVVEQRLDAAHRRTRRATVAAVLAVAGTILWSTTPEVRAQFGLTLTNLNARLLAVEAKTAALTDDGTNFAITGRNVHIVDGSGQTVSNSALGNLTVGYNISRGGGNDRRDGSHNLIVGEKNNYRSSGGLVVGYQNEISGGFASVSGGSSNTASGAFSSVSGGEFNVASSQLSSVSGGSSNMATGAGASVSGGYNRSATNLHNWAAGMYFSGQ